MTFLADDKRVAIYPFATTLLDLVTAEQLRVLRQSAKRAGVDLEAECQKYLHCTTADLSTRAASAFIQHLERRAGAG